MTFPTDWPPGCPPADTKDTSGVFYRIVKTSPPTADDFRTFHEMGKRLRGALPCPCMPYGLSVFPNREDAAWMTRVMPKLGNHLARGVLEAGNGPSKLTPGQRPSHTTWWPSCECDRSGCFPDVEDVA